MANQLKKLNVTYIYTSYSTITREHISNPTLPSTTRVMTNILNKQKELNVIYSQIPIQAILYFIDKVQDDYSLLHKQFCSGLFKSVTTDYILLTLGNMWEIQLCIDLLNNNKKVVVGGPLTKIYTIKQLRDIFEFNGAINLNNLLIVRPYINDTINLFNIIMRWKDIDDDVKFDTTDIFVTSNDFYLDQYPIFKDNNINYTMLSTMLSTQCNWNKCKFCMYTNHNEISATFINESNYKLIASILNNIMNKYNLLSLSIMDPEFYFTSLNKKFLNELRFYNKRVVIMVSIRQLKSSRYIDYIFNEYPDVISGIMIGVETFDDFALKLLNKGNTRQEAIDILDTIIALNKHTFLIFLFMINLATNNKQSVINSYNDMLLLKKKLKIFKIEHEFSIVPFQATPIIDYTSNPYISLNDNTLKLFNTYDRIDENGDILPIDRDIIDINSYNKLIQNIRW